MATDKKQFVSAFTEGEAVHDLFLIKDADRAETKSGKPYLILTLMDRSGEISCRLWEDADRWAPVCQAGDVVTVVGQVQNYKGENQLKIDELGSVAQAEIDISLFLPATARDIDEMAAELQGLVKRVEDPYLKKLLQKFFAAGDFFDRFKKAPAAKNMHHAYLGGLLEHTLAVTRLARSMTDQYPSLDGSLLVAGALLHDIGKVEEFSFATYPFNYSDRGRLVGHLVIGAEMVRERVGAIKDFPEELAIRIQHLILSHHGQYEFGSPCLPMMPEAFVLNFLDDLDAKMNYLGGLEKKLAAPGYQWTDYQRLLERFLFLRGRPGQETAAGEKKPGKTTARDNDRQQSLFTVS